MAYNPYFPTYYPSASPYMPLQAPTTPQNAPQTSNSGIVWVQGENAAKAYPVASGQSVLLMDSEESVMYIKSTDQSGMPLPLRIFDYSERKSGTSQGHIGDISGTTDYVSREEFNAFKEDISKQIGQKGGRNTKVSEDKSNG